MKEHTRRKVHPLLILLGLLLVSCLVIYKDYLFGNKILAFTDIGSDTYDQYLMHYQTIIRHLREGTFSLWDFYNGYGINMLALNLLDPFLMLLYLWGVLFGGSSIYTILVILQIARICCAGAAVYGYLSCFSFSWKSKVLAAYAYGLSGYLIVWGQHYQFGTILILFPLLLLATEKTFCRKRYYLGLTGLCALCCMISVYFGYMQLLTLGVYVLFRTAWKERLFSIAGAKRIGKLYGSMLLGIGISMFSLLPSASMLMGVSGRVSGDSLLDRVFRLPWHYAGSYYATLLKRFFSSNLEGINSYSGYTNFYEDTNVFVSVLFLFAVVQVIFWFFRRNYTGKQKALFAGAFGLGGFLLLVPLGGMIYNAFAYPFSRHTFVLLPFFVWMIADMLDEIFTRRNLCRPLLLVTAIAVVTEYVRVYLGIHSKLALVLLAATVMMTVSLWGLSAKETGKLRGLCTAGLTLSLMAMMSTDGWYSCSYGRVALEKSSEYFDEMYEEDVQEALQYLRAQDDSFYRVEKDYTVGTATSCLNSLAQGYRGISTYNSTLNSGVKRFLQEFWTDSQVVDENHYSFANGVQEDFWASLSHVKYVLSKRQELGVPGYERYGKIGKIYLYRNTQTDALGKFYSAAYTEEDYESVKDQVDREALLADTVLCDTVPHLRQDAGEMEKYFRKPTLDESQIAMTKPDAEHIVLEWTPEKEGKSGKYRLEFDLSYPQALPEVQIMAGGHVTRVTAVPGGTHVNVAVPEDTAEVTIEQLGLPFAENAVISHVQLYFEETHDLIARSKGVYFAYGEKDSVLSGTAKVTEDGILMVAIPYENGWHAYVDGRETELHQVDYGFSGICLSGGEHEIRMEFHCPGWSLGVGISIVSLLLTAGIWNGVLRRERRKGGRKTEK